MRGSRSHVPSSRRGAGASAPCQLAVAIGSALGIALPFTALAGDSVITASDAPGRDLGTQVENPDAGRIYNVRSGRTRGQVDFNSFRRFEVATEDTVNLHLSTGATTVVNLVWDARALINGTLNSYKGGEIGGRVVFADTHGLVVGPTGTLNVGSLAVATPTSAFMDLLVSSDTATADAATSDLLRGTVPLSGGAVTIAGNVHARDDVRIQARAIDVTGTVWVAAGTGEDALDSAVAVNTGAGDGVRLVNDGGNLLLVASDSVSVAGTLHADGGDIVLQSDDSVRLRTGAVLDTRALGAGDRDLTRQSTGDSGDITVAGRDLSVDAGARLHADADGTHAAGDIDIAAAARARVQTGLAQAHSRARIDGSLRGGDVTVSATSVADADWDDPDASLQTIAGNALVELAQRAGTSLGGTIGYMAVDTRAEVAIGAAAVIDARGDVDLQARTQQAIKTSLTGLRGDAQKQSVLSLGALYADLDTDAVARVESGASIDAGGTLDVAARTDSSLDVSVTSFAADGTAAAMTLAFSDVDVRAQADVADGARLGVGGLRVGALNRADFSTSATAHSDDDGVVGLAAAISLQDLHADAQVGSDVTTTGDVVIEAASLVDRNATTAEVSEPPKKEDRPQASAGGDAEGGDAVAGLLGKALGALSGAIGDQGEGSDQSGQSTPPPFRLGSAITFTDGRHGAQARLADGATIRAGGDFATHAAVVDAGIGITARSAIDAKGENPDNPGSPLSLSAGVALTNLRHEALAEVGDGADVQAARIGVGAEVHLPMDLSKLQAAIPDFSSFGAFMESMNAAKSAAKSPWELFTSYVGAKSKADDAAIGGTINHYRVTNRSQAWVGDGARLTSTAPAGAGAWDTALAGDGRTAAWDASVTVRALTDALSLHSAGELGLGLPVGAGQGGAAVGGSFNNVVYDTRTVAGLAQGVVVDSHGAVAVDATTRDRVVSLALMAGGGGSIGINGTLALLDVDSATYASVSRDARVTAEALGVNALQDLFAWSVSGALSMSDSLSVGLGVGVHNLRTDTRAFVGDNRADAPDAPAGTVPVGGVAGSGHIETDALAVQARSTGMAGAVAVAGAVAKSSAAPDPNAKPGVIDRIKASAQTRTDALRGKAADSFGNLPVLGGLADKLRGEQGAPASQQQPSEPKFGISVSGSASVNLIEQATTAHLDGAQVRGRNGGATAVDVAALNDTTLASASGSAAITLAKASSSKFSAAIGGAVSFAQIDNDTDAYIEASTLENARQVAVHALSGGEQTNVALGVSVNKSTDQQSAVSIAGSFSIGESSNTTRAWVGHSGVDAGTGSNRSFDLAAYNRTRIGVGAGSLYFGGRGGVGAAFTLARIGDTTTATIDGGTVSGYDTASVRALDAARIVAGAAMAGGGGESNGLGGAVVYNQVGNTTRARIGAGALLDVNGELLVQARSTAPVQAFEQRLAQVGDNPDSSFDYSGDALGIDADGVQASLSGAGTSIIGVAGLVQAGKNNIGLSFVGNDVDNRHEVEVAGATLRAADAVRLDAADSTAILGISFGVGVATDKFAGMGNATANMIDNRTAVRIGSDGLDTVIDAAALQVRAEDASFIGSLAGNIVVGSKAAAGAAVGYNHIGNWTGVEVRDARLDVDGEAALRAKNAATIVAGAIAGSVGNNAAVSGSFAWSDIGNTTRAALAGSQVRAGALALAADSDSDIATLSGSVAVSGTAAIGAAINIARIADTTEAELVDTRAAVEGDIAVGASGSGIARSLAVAGAVSNNVSVAGSSSTAQVDNHIRARVDGLRGVDQTAAGADALRITARNTGEAHSLAGAVSGSSSAAVGGAISTNLIGGGTTAELTDSILAVREAVAVEAVSHALVNTLAGAGSASSVGIAGTATTNIVTRDTRAMIADTALAGATADSLVRASDDSEINSIAGSLGFGTSVGVGAAVAVNTISSDVGAQMLGGAGNRRYHGRNLMVDAGSGGEINTLAAGIGGGGSVGGAASVAVNLMDGNVLAEIAQGADVVAEHNVGVLARNQQDIDVLAGSLGIGAGAAGIGVGTVVNVMEGTTRARITGADTRVSALARDADDRMRVDDGRLANVSLSGIGDFDDYVAPDMTGGVREVTGLAVNAATRQQVTTLGASGAFGAYAGVSMMAGVNIVGGTTEALIDGAAINRHPEYRQVLDPATGIDPDELDRQMVDVGASSHVVGASLIAGIAGSGVFGGAGALATNVFNGSTVAGIRDAGLSALQGVRVDANASQNSLVIAAGLAGGIVGGAGSGVVNVFSAETNAFTSGGSLEARELSIAAANRNAASLHAGAASGGAAAVAGAFLVNVSQTSTRARLGEAGRRTDVATRGDVRVQASADTGVEGVAVSGAAAGAAGIAGMAQINVVGNQVEAGIVDADVDARGDIAVSAAERVALRAMSGAMGIGLGGTGVGAGASVAVLGSKVLASVSRSDLDASGDVSVAAASDRSVDMLTMTGGAGLSTGIGGAASLLLSGVGATGQSSDELGGTLAALESMGGGNKLDARALEGSVDAGRLAAIEGEARVELAGAMGGRQDQVIARVVDSRVDARAVGVEARNLLSTRNLAGGAGVGGVGIGGAFAFSGLYGETIATIEQATPGATVVNADRVTVLARNGDGLNGATADVDAYAGAAGLAGIGAAVAVAQVDQEIRAHAGGRFVGSGAMRVAAEDTGKVDVAAIGAAAGAAAVGIVVADARRSSTVDAALLSGAEVAGFNTLALVANAAGAVSAYGLGASGGLLAAGTGVGVTARDDTRVLANVGDDVSVETQAGTTVDATAVQAVSASGRGASVSAGVGLGAVVVDAGSATDVQARVGDRARFGGAGGLALNAGLRHAGEAGVRADSVAGSGGLYLSVNASSAHARNHASVTAEAGSGLQLLQGALQIQADSLTSQRADASGVSVGGIAAGAVLASAESQTRTHAHLGDGARHPDGATRALDQVLVAANGDDLNIANATAGSGGIISGNAAKAATRSKADVSATLGDDVALAAGAFGVHATHVSRYGGGADSRNAAVIGGSGADLEHVADASVHAGIGADTELMAARSIDVLARNSFQAFDESRVSAAGGGVINGSAAGIRTRLDGRTSATIGEGATLRSGLEGGISGDISVVAATLASSRDTADLSTGGAIDVAVVNSHVAADFANSVAIGRNALLDSRGYVNLGTYTQTVLQSTALVNTWGLAAVGTSRSNVDVVDRQSVTLAEGATTESLRNTYIVAGSDALGLQDSNIGVVATSEGYVRGLIAVPASSADVAVDSSTLATLAAGSRVLSASNVTVGATDAKLSLGASGIGRGYQLGFIPTTQRSSNIDSRAEGDLVIDGTVVAGRYNELDIVVDADGQVRLNAGLPVFVEKYNDFDMDAFLEQLCGADPSLDGCKAIAALRNIIGPGSTNALVFDPLFAAGGDVFLDATRISGNGDVSAQGAPRISLVNNSNYHLLLSEIEIPDNPGGHVNFTGGADSAGNVRVTASPSSELASVLIHNTASSGPAMLAMDDIRNISGRVTLRSDFGSIGQFGTVYAAQQNVHAPNGIVSFSNRNADWFSGSNPRSDWRFALREGFGSAGRDVDVAVVAIANSQYGGGSQQALHDNLYYRAPVSGTGDGHSGSSVIVFGGCLHGTNGGNNNAADGCTGGPFGTFKTRYGANMPNVPVLDASYFKRSRNYSDNPSVATNAAASSFTGQQIFVQARYIDINSRISAGAGTNWSLQVNDDAALQSWLSMMERYGSGVRRIPSTLLSVVGADSRQIGASYDIVNRRIIVDNINASGGGYVHLDGNIVSTTPHGKVEVSSGFGKVEIDSSIGRPLQLQDINVGAGQAGVVTIVDRLKPATSSGDPYTVWYVSESGKPTRAVDNRNGATSYDDARAFAVDKHGYDPVAGMRYFWSEQANVSRAGIGGDWYWVDQYGRRLDDDQQWRLLSQGFGQAGSAAAQMAAYESQAYGSFTSFARVNISYGCNKGKCSYGYQQGYNGQNVGAGGDGRILWSALHPLAGFLRVDSSVKADNRIAINFLGSSHGLIDVQAAGDLLLSGRIYNPGGLTRLGTSASLQGGLGDIIRTTDRAMLTSRRLEIDAAGGVGTGGKGDLLVAVGDEGALVAGAVQRGIRVRSASSAGVNLDVSTDAPVEIVSGSATAGYGNVKVSALQGITGLTPGADADIIGGNITLASSFGGIGSLSRPLRLRAYESFLGENSLVGGVVTAAANGDIALRDASGDFWLGSIISRYGDVHLHAADGALLDASQRLASDGLTQEQIDRVRDRLGLYGTGIEASVQAHQRAVEASYAEYWQLRALGQVVDGRFIANAQAVPLFRAIAEASLGVTAISDQQVLDFLRDRYAGLEAGFAVEFGPQWHSRPEFSVHDTGFAYVIAPGSERYQALARNAVWTPEQLRYTINANALRASGGAVGAAEPTVSGRNLHLQAAAGIGRFAGDLDIDYVDLLAGNLDDVDALSLALANAPGDVRIIHSDGRVLSPEELAALTQADIDAGAIKSVRVRRTSPLFVEATGRLTGASGGNAFVQARGNLTLAGFDIAGNGRVAASGQLAGAADSAGPVLTTGGDLVLSAGSGIGLAGAGGAQDAPLVVDVGGRLDSATSGQHLLLRQASGDLRFGTMSANGRIGIEVPQGSLLGYLDDIALDGRGVRLSAQGHIAGEDDSGRLRALKLNVSGDGRLDADAGGRIWLSSPERGLDIGTLTAGQRIDLLVEGGALTADSLVARAGALNAAAWGNLRVGLASASQGVTLTSLGTLRADAVEGSDVLLVAADDLEVGVVDAAGNATLQAGAAVRLDADGAVAGHTVDIDAGQLDMGAGSGIRAAAQVVVRTTADQRIGHIQVAGDGTGGRIELDAGGRILANGDDVIHVEGGAGVDAHLMAGDGIGEAQQAVRVAVGGQLDGASAQGDMHLHLPQGAQVGTLRADEGSVHIDAGDRLAFGTIAAAHALRITGTGMQGGVLQAGGAGMAIEADEDIAVALVTAAGDATLSSGGDTTIGTLDVGGALSATAGQDLAIDSGTVAGDALLTSTAATTLGNLAVGQALTLDAGSDLAADRISTGGAAAISVGQDAHVATLAVGEALTLAAGRALALGAATTGGNATLSSGGDTTIDTLDVGGALSATAGQDLAIDSGTVVGDAVLASTAATTLGSLAVGQALTLDAGSDLAADRISTGGAAAISAGQDAHVATLAVGEALTLAAGRALALGAATTGGNATLSSGGDTTIDTLDVGGALSATAGQDLAIDSGTVVGDATLQAARDLRVTTLAVGGDLDAAAVAGSLALSTTDVHGDARLRSGADMRLGRATIGGDLEARAGASLEADTLVVDGSADLGARDLRITEATVAGDAVLASTAATTLGSLAVGQALTLDAGSDLAADRISTGGAAAISVGQDAQVATLAVGEALTLAAGRHIGYGALSAGGDARLDAHAGDIVGDSARIAGDAAYAASRDLRTGSVEAGGRIDMQAGHDVQAGLLAARGSDVQVDAGHDIDADVIEAARDVLLSAGNAIRFGTLRGGRDVAADAGAGLAFDALEVARDLRLRSRSADIHGGTMTVGRDAVLDAATAVSLATASVGQHLGIDAGEGIVLGRYTVGGRTDLDAGGSIRVEDAQGTGLQQWDAGGGIAFGRVQGASAVRMDARGGALQGRLLEAPEADLAARDRITLDLARIDSRLDLASAEIAGSVVQTGTGDAPISMVLTGYRDGVARRVVLSVDARDAWMMDRLAAVQAELDTTVAKVDIADGRIEESMRLTTPVTRTWMHNQDPRLQAVDLQLTEPGMDFMLRQRGHHSFTDAYVVRYGEGFWVQAPNHLAPHLWTDVDYYAESALRFTFRTLEGESWAHQGLARHAFGARRPVPASQDDPVESMRGAVNTGISP